VKSPNPDLIVNLVKYHLNKVIEYNPYKSFPGVKTRNDFCNIIGNDPAFCHFGLNDERYVIGRIGGNLITSLHRKLGDMYEDIFKYLLKTRFNLPDSDLNYSVDVTIGNRHQTRSTDGILKISYLNGVDLPSLSVDWRSKAGLGFEVRSCYQIGDSKRIQADYDMALSLLNNGYIPIMIVFCNTSLRSPIIRLRKSWILFHSKPTGNPGPALAGPGYGQSIYAQHEDSRITC
jgi:hypothetical protein